MMMMLNIVTRHERIVVMITKNEYLIITVNNYSKIAINPHIDALEI